MKVCILFIIYTLSISYCFGQDITLSVLGFSSYTEYAESNVLLISTNDATLEKITILNDSIRVKGMDNTLVAIDGLKSSKKNQYKIEEKDKNEFDKLLVLCDDLQIRVDKVYFKMPEHLFEEEDEKAIMAMNNANSRAKVLANHLGYKIDKILNIDDDTTYSSSIYDDIDFDSKRGEVLVQLLELLGGRNLLDNSVNSNPTRNRGYNLWVTYNLKKK